MVTVATRVEPNEVERLKSLAQECNMSLCGYMRELIRKELSRAERSADRSGESSLDNSSAGNSREPLVGAAEISDAVA